MAVELATAYISLSASTKGLSRDVKSFLGDTQKGFDRTGRASGKSLGSGLGKGLKIGTTAIAAMGATVAGLALKGGISRALNIEDAQAKLKGLGHSTKSIEKIMDSALESVKGTAFGLGDAATVAASTVAAGVKPGKDLTRTLKLVADASTIAGTSMSDMGLIFNKVAGTGKIQGEVIAQLGERGIPILQLLADEMGVSAAEVGKLASAGEVGFEQFQNAMEKGMGGAALQSGKTARGAWANMLAALSRVGEKVVSKIMPKITGAFGTITGWADAFAPVAERAGEALGRGFEVTVDYVSSTVIPALGDVADVIREDVIPALQDAVGWVKQNRDWLIPLTAAIAASVAVYQGYAFVAGAIAAVKLALEGLTIAQWLLNAAMAANPVGIIIAAVAGLIAGIVILWNTNEGFRTAVTTAWTAIQSAVGAVVGWFQTNVLPALTAIWDGIKAAATSVADWYMTHVAPVFQAAGELIKAYIERVGAIFGWLWDNAVKPYLTLVMDLWSKVWSGVKAVWDKIGPPIIDVVSAGFKNLWTIIKGIWNGIKGSIETALGVIKGILKTATAVLKGDWSGAWDAIKGIADTIWGGLKKGFQNAMDTIGSVITTLKDTIVNAVSGAGTWLLDAGKKIIDGLLDGIGAGFQKVKNKLGELTNLLPDWKGPAKRDAVILKPAGKLLMAGLVAGITEGMDLVKKSLTGVTDSLAKIAENGVKREADRLIAARKKANDRIAAVNKAAAKKRDAGLAAADKISDSKKRAAEKKRVQAAYKAAKKDPLGALSRADATKKATQNLRSTLDATKRAQQLINEQGRTTGVTRAQLLAGLNADGTARSAAIGNVTLADIAKVRESVATSIAAAKQTLDDLKKGRADLAAQVASSIKGELDLTAGIGQDTTTPWGHTVAGKTTFESVSGVVKTLAAKAMTFAGKLKDLIAKGIPAGLVQEVAGLGTTNGIKVADALLSGTGMQVQELAADYASLGHWSAQAGEYVAGSMYDVGIQAQQGIIDGFLADDAKLVAAAKTLSDRLTRAIKSQLKIKSPSRVMRDEVGVMLSRGVVAGMDQEQGALDRRAANLVGVPEVGAAAPMGGDAGAARMLSDADIDALAWAMSQVQVKAAYDNRAAADIAQRGIREASRSDRGSMLQSLGVRS